MTEQIDYWQESKRLVAEFFKREPHKIKLWWLTKNPGLGNVSPVDMLLVGREKKLYEFIKSSLEGNRP